MDPNHPLDPRFGRYPPPSAATGPAKPFHRRAHSETVLRLPDDFLFDDPDFSIADLDFPSLSDDSTPTPFPKPEPLPDASTAHGSGHFRSLSVDAAFFEGLELDPKEGEKRGKHRHSTSMDGSVSPFEDESAEPFEFVKKAMAADKLAELALIDPKRAKRILANRQSAARSKERKVRYMSELERKVQTLQTEATTLTAQLAMLQRDTTDLTNENKELKLRLQAMEQQAHLRDALNEALRDEVQRLKIATGQMPTVNGSMFGRGLQQPLPQYFPHHQQLHNIRRNQAQQQLHVNHPSSNNQQTNEQAQVDSMEFM